jgi:hypothetical protein
MRCRSASHSGGLLRDHQACGWSSAATELTLFSKVYDLGAALKIGVIGKAAAPGRLPDEAVVWAALRLPNCYPACAFSKRSLQATTMPAIDASARLDRDWLSRGMSDPASPRAHAPATLPTAARGKRLMLMRMTCPPRELKGARLRTLVMV